MKRIKKYIIWCASVAAVLSLIPLQSLAFNDQETAKSDTNHGLELMEKIGEWAAVSTRYSLDMLGITGMECNCTFTAGKEGQLWLFHAEPKINGVDRKGPSHGILKQGDVIVSIDGMLITTRKAGIRFANLIAGEPVELTVRRWGRTRSVTVVPQEALKLSVPIDLTVRRDDPLNTVTIQPRASGLPELARKIESLSLSATKIGRVIDDMGLPFIPEFALIPELDIDLSGHFPRGWIGFGLSFSGKIRRKDPGEPCEWRFNDPPLIKSVLPDSPADEAGLQIDDVLLEIDGLKLDSRKGGKRFSRMEPGQIIEWTVQRGGKTFTVETEAGERPELTQIDSASALSHPMDVQPLRYTGSLDGTEIEVRGGGNVQVEVDEETGEIVIRSVDSVTRLKPSKK